MADVWEERVAAAVKKVYAEADMKLEALQLDLLEPRADGTRWTVYQVRRRRTEQALVSMRDGLREMGRTVERSFAHVGAAASDAARAITAAYSTTTTRGDYTLAADTGDTP